jgi:hypothetical protein
LKGLYGGQCDFITKLANTDTLSSKMNVKKMIDDTVPLALSVLRKRLHKSLYDDPETIGKTIELNKYPI